MTATPGPSPGTGGPSVRAGPAGGVERGAAVVELLVVFLTLLVPTDVEAPGEAMPRVTIERAAGVKCERCWRIVPAVSTEPASAGLCERCQGALAEMVNG